MTTRDLITGALRLLGVLASGETMGDSEASDALVSFNDMLDSWSTDNLYIPNKTREVFPLIAGQQSYTMGTGGNFNTARPLWVENALVQTGSGQGTIEIPVKIVTKDEFSAIVVKQVQSTYPTYVYPEGTYPLETLNFWPVPTGAANIVLYTAKPLSTSSTLNTALSLPPGYNRALRYSLAVELAPEYEREVPEYVAGVAAEAKANIKRVNHRPKYLQVDDALRGKPAAFNWYTGDTS